MPYKIYSQKGKYRVCKPGGKKCFSKKGLSKAKAEAQQKALYASENVKESLNSQELISDFFDLKNVVDNGSTKRATYDIKTDADIDLIVYFVDGEAETIFIRDRGDLKGRDIKLADVGPKSTKETGPYSEHTKNVLRLYTPKLFKKIKSKEHLEEILDAAVQKGFNKDQEDFRESLQFEELAKSILAE